MNNFKPNSLPAWMLRQKNIQRWSLMSSENRDNDAEHSFEVAVIAHTIASYGVALFNREYCPNEIGMMALFHELSEACGVGDIPSPLKYSNPALTAAIKEIEHDVEVRVSKTVIPELHGRFERLVVHEAQPPLEKAIVKAADDICAYLFCTRELASNTDEFLKAFTKLSKKLDMTRTKLPEVEKFFELNFELCNQSLDNLIEDE